MSGFADTTAERGGVAYGNGSVTQRCQAEKTQTKESLRERWAQAAVSDGVRSK